MKNFFFKHLDADRPGLAVRRRERRRHPVPGRCRLEHLDGAHRRQRGRQRPAHDRQPRQGGHGRRHVRLRHGPQGGDELRVPRDPAATARTERVRRRAQRSYKGLRRPT